MVSVPIIQGKKVNRFLCLLFLVLTGICLGTASVFSLLHKPEISSVSLILAMIMGGFSLFYGLSWLFWSRKEKTAEEALQAANRQKLPRDPGRITYREFILPKASLTESAFRRFLNIVRWSGAAALAVFLLISGIQLFAGSLQKPLQLVYILLFCLLITLPGISVQGVIYKKYEHSVPQRILLYPGKIVIDKRTFPARDVRGIRISPDRIYNQNSPAVFRNLLIQTNGSDAQYRIDYRSGTVQNEQPFWEEFRQFSRSLVAWGEENSVPVSVAYMD